MNLALPAAAATGIQVGAATVGSRFVVGESPPLTPALLRHAIGATCLVPLAVVVAPHNRSRMQSAPVSPRPGGAALRDWCVMGLLGIGHFGVLIAALNHGPQTVDATRAAMIFSLFPMPTLLLSAALGHVLLHESMDTSIALAVVLVTVGLRLSTRAPVPAAAR